MDIRQLIREMSVANPLWEAPRIHGELLKLASTSARRPSKIHSKEKSGHRRKAGRPSFNHADAIASIDLFVVPTISFRLLYGFLVLRHSRPENSLAGRDRTSEC